MKKKNEGKIGDGDACAGESCRNNRESRRIAPSWCIQRSRCRSLHRSYRVGIAHALQIGGFRFPLMCACIFRICCLNLGILPRIVLCINSIVGDFLDKFEPLEACGIPKKPEDLVINIDEADTENELAVVEYVEEIYEFYRLTEGESRVPDYMAAQTELNERMRSILVDWLIEVHYKFELRPETLYLTINIIDRFLAVKIVPRKELRLVGMGALLIASKFEEIWATEVNDLVSISDRAYTKEQVRAMEKSILGKLEWLLTVPTPYMFLPRFIKASLPSSDTEMENMVSYFAELGIMNYSVAISYSPSMLAASSVYAARCTLDKGPSWTVTLKHYTGYSEDQLKGCAKLLVNLHSLAPESKLQSVYKKFSKTDFDSVALRSPAKSLLA